MPAPTSPDSLSKLERLEAENRALRHILQTLTSDAAHNETAMQRFQERELALLQASGLPDLVERLTTGLRASFGLECVLLVLFDPHGVLAELFHTLGVRESRLPHLRLERDAHGAMARYPDLGQPWLGPWQKRHQPSPPPRSGLRSEALLPLRQPDGISGFLHLASQDPRRFRPTQGAAFMQRLASVAAVCLENAVNRERLRLSGLTDGLTGLYNRRHLETRLREEIVRATRHRHTLGCLFIDADHFKRINDQYGHAAGDQVLVTLARRIRDQLRGSDLAVRYGGEEITVLLPQTHPENACRLGERIRQAVADAPFPLTDETSIPVTVSIGVSAITPQRNDDAEHLSKMLLESADRRVYAAKQAGRNRVCCADGDAQ